MRSRAKKSKKQIRKRSTRKSIRKSRSKKQLKGGGPIYAYYRKDYEIPTKGRFLQVVYENLQYNVKKGCQIPKFDSVVRRFTEKLTKNVKMLILWDSPKRQYRNDGPELNFYDAEFRVFQRDREFIPTPESTTTEGYQQLGTVAQQVYFTKEIPFEDLDDDSNIRKIKHLLEANSADRIIDLPCGSYELEFRFMENTTSTVSGMISETSLRQTPKETTGPKTLWNLFGLRR